MSKDTSFAEEEWQIKHNESLFGREITGRWFSIETKIQLLELQ